MKKIKVLDDITVQKIAAGEVVERPASIVKELVENSIDAGGKNIVVEIKAGGKEYIRVTDDGEGISELDLDLAFEKHSTSKLSEIEDLYRITSLGFRGEALSSISTVSKVEVMTKTESSLGGIQAKVEEGKIISKDIVGTPKGTTMIVRDLFYNLPVRKDFLKSNLIETNRISDVIYKIAIGNPDCSFKYIKDNEVILNTNRNNNFQNHIYAILGKEISSNLTELEFKNENIGLKGYISNNELYRGNRSHQYLYINGRYVSDKDISRSIEEQYRSIIPINRFPVYILFLDIDPSRIDVNIHPTKQEVKFSDHNTIINIIKETVRNTLYNDVKIPRVSFNKKSEKKEIDEIPTLFDFRNNDESKVRSNDARKVSDSTSVIVKDFRDSVFKDDDIYIKESGKKLFDNFELDKLEEYNTKESNNDLNNNFKDELNSSELKEIKINETLDNLQPIGVIFTTYILAEDRINKKFYFIDQHAAHERIMYEKYLKEFKNEEIYIQQLLTPEILELTNKELNTVIENKDLFSKLGFDIDIFGTNSIIIRGVPIIFGNPNIKTLFIDLLDNMYLNPTNNYDLRVDKIMKIACVNSIKSGDKLVDEEILELFQQLKNCENPYSCPHGRPTMLEMSKKDIEKEFLRIM